MELTKEKIVKNTKRYLEAAKKYGAMTEELEILLGEDLIKAPATNLKDLNNAFEGGLVDHILRVMKHAYKLNENNLSANLKISEESLFKVVLLHAIGKVKLFTPETDAWQRDKRGKFYNYNNDLISMRIGERSAYYALNCGIKLTEEEYAAITNHDKMYDSQTEWHNPVLGDILKLAIKLAIIEEKNK